MRGSVKRARSSEASKKMSRFVSSDMSILALHVMVRVNLYKDNNVVIGGKSRCCQLQPDFREQFESLDLTPPDATGPIMATTIGSRMAPALSNE